MRRHDIPATRHTPGNAAPAALAPVAAVATLLLLLVPAGGLVANGGIVRIARAPVGPYLVTVYSSPTPLRTGEVDVSVLVQDSADAVLDIPILVRARPLALAEGETAEEVRHEASREQATNKLFKAAKFDLNAPGEWGFQVSVGDAGTVEFEAEVARSTILDRPYLLALLVLLPLAVLGWLLLGRDENGAAGELEGGGARP